MIVVDTDVASRIRKGTVPPRLVRQLAGRPIYVTFVTVAELTAWLHRQPLGDDRRVRLGQWIDGLRVLPYRPDVAKHWGGLTAAATRRGRTPPANDTWLAAACIDAGLPLATLNAKDFAEHAAHGGLRLVAV